MGNCASTSSSSSSVIHDDSYGHENAVYYKETVAANTNRIGSTYSHAGAKGLNQDSAILFQVLLYSLRAILFVVSRFLELMHNWKPKTTTHGTKKILQNDRYHETKGVFCKKRGSIGTKLK